MSHDDRVQVSLYTFVSPLGSSMMAPALPEIGTKYSMSAATDLSNIGLISLSDITNPTLLALTLSVFLISFAFGPLILAPLSEMYGRSWVNIFRPSSVGSSQRLMRIVRYCISRIWFTWRSI